MNNELEILSLLKEVVSRQAESEIRQAESENVLKEVVSRQAESETLLKQVISRQDKADALYETLVSVQKELVEKTDIMKAELTDTKHHVVLLENESKQKFGALADGQRVLTDYVKELKADVSDIKEELFMHDLRIKAIDSKKRKTS